MPLPPLADAAIMPAPLTLMAHFQLALAPLPLPIFIIFFAITPPLMLSLCRQLFFAAYAFHFAAIFIHRPFRLADARPPSPMPNHAPPCRHAITAATITPCRRRHHAVAAACRRLPLRAPSPFTYV
jgi:hypothetical protein